MIRIEKSTIEDAVRLAKLGRETFIESHGDSASKAAVENYLNENYTQKAFQNELKNSLNNYHSLYNDQELVGYSKIVFNVPCEHIAAQNITKLERIYLLESCHGKGLGEELLYFNMDLAKSNGQQGIWLYTWVENRRAIGFYKKMGFEIVGEHDFRISATHSNPNWVMMLGF